MSAHPSRLALDRLALTGGASPELDAHLAGCAECREHLSHLREPLPPAPAWVTAQARPPPWRFPRFVLAFAAVTAAALLVVVLRPRPDITPKGLPAVTVWLKRGDKVSTWDGASPVREGDAIRLEATPSGYSYLTVVSAPEGKPAVVLFSARLDASGRPTLTPAWQLDGSPEPERLAVLFTTSPVSDPGPLLARRDAEAWSIHEVFPKESP